MCHRPLHLNRIMPAEGGARATYREHRPRRAVSLFFGG
jgi:hypothetical protein